MRKLDERPSLGTKEEELQALGKGLWLLADEYKLGVKELVYLLDVGERTLYEAKKKSEVPSVTNDRILRLGHLLGIKKNLEILFPRNPEVRANWLRVKRDTFKGKSALELIKEGSFESMNRLFTVRRILDMLRSGAIHELV